MTQDLVSVVIPAHNAATTLETTLCSVRSQTHAALEIIVVDDGSTDDTRSVAERHAEGDARVQVLTQENAGVAAARNTGWRRAQSELIAFVDADDLWAPTKIERQFQCLRDGDDRVGLVYCWSVRINDDDMIIGVPDAAHCEAYVLDRLLCGNFIGNGSSVLVRRQAIVDAGGFESGLRAAGAEGCEDFLFYNRVAERHHFGFVPEYLVGYRYRPKAMSADKARMLRSWMMVCDEMHTRHPELKRAIRTGLRNYSGCVARDALASDPRQLPIMLLVLLRRDPSIAMWTLLRGITLPFVKAMGNRLRGTAPATGQRFRTGHP